MINSVLKAVNEFSLLGDYHGATVTVALSGGADSMALLHSLLELKERLGIKVEAAHFNHLIRGEEAYRDEEFVKEQCRKLDVKLYTGQEDVPAYAENKGISLETAARELRYAFLRRINKDFVATAHTASDNLETVIFNLSRGSALEGLCGIPPKRDIFIRPLILCTREKIESYCSENKIPYVTDSTNLCDDYTRNKIRHKIVPLLKELNGSVENAVTRSAGFLKSDSDFINGSAEDFLASNIIKTNELSLDGFLNLHFSVASRAVKKFTERCIGESCLSSVHIRDIMSLISKGGSVNIPKGFIAEKQDGKLILKRNSDIKQNNTRYLVDITETKENFLNLSQNVNNLLLKNSIDCDKIIGKSVLRTRQAGDSIRLKNRGCTKSLHKLYNECKIPKDERESLPVLADDKGVIWIYGIGVAHRCAVDKNTRRILIINTKKTEKN